MQQGSNWCRNYACDAIWKRFQRALSISEATMYKCASPALRAKPLDSPGPIIWAVSVLAFLQVPDASLSGLFAAIGYLVIDKVSL